MSIVKFDLAPALVLRGVDREAAAVSVHDAADDGQAEAHSPSLAISIGFEPEEWNHHFLSEFFRNAGPVVMNGQPYLLILLRELEQNVPAGVLHRVSENVLHRSLEEMLIGKDAGTPGHRQTDLHRPDSRSSPHRSRSGCRVFRMRVARASRSAARVATK